MEAMRGTQRQGYAGRASPIPQQRIWQFTRSFIFPRRNGVMRLENYVTLHCHTMRIILSQEEMCIFLSRFMLCSFVADHSVK
jgi:hypothetical protein